MRGVRIALLILAGSRFGVPAQQEGSRWLKLSTPHFEMYTQAGERPSRDALLRFEQIRSFFAQTLGQGRTFLQAKVRVLAFRSQKEFEPYRAGDTAAAYFTSSFEQDYIVLGRVSGEVLPIAMHEYVHLVIRHSGYKIPLWLNEGLAEVYSSLRPLAGKLAVGDILPERLDLLRSTRWLDMETLTSARDFKDPMWDKSRVSLFYAQSWALTHMLALSPEYRTRFEAFVLALHEGAGAEEAFTRIYGKPLQIIRRDLESYLSSDRFRVALFDVKLEKSAENPRPAPVSEAEAGLVLSDLLVAIGRHEEAEAALNRLESRWPGRWEIAAARGRAAMRAGRWEEAVQHLARAVESEEAGPKIRYDYARLLMRLPQHAELAIAQLQQAVRMDPDFADAHYHLRLLLLERGLYGQALGSFARVRNLPPQQAFPFFIALSKTYYHLGDLKESLRAAQRAAKHARNEEESAQAARLVRALESGVGAAEFPQETVRSEAGSVDRPGLRRAPVTDHPPRPPEQEAPPPSVTGILQGLDCLGARARLRIGTEGKQVALLIEDPNSVVVVGESGVLQLSCGPQKPRPVTIEYRPAEDPETGTIGVVVMIRLQ